MILLPLTIISNSSHLLFTCIYQLLGEKNKKSCFWDPVTSSCPCCCLLHPGLQEHAPCTLPSAAAVSVLLWASRVGKLSCSCCPVSLSGSGTGAVCPSSPRAGTRQPARTSASPCPCGPGWRPSPWDTAIFWVGARGRQAHLVLDM